MSYNKLGFLWVISNLSLTIERVFKVFKGNKCEKFLSFQNQLYSSLDPGCRIQMVFLLAECSTVLVILDVTFDLLINLHNYV